MTIETARKVVDMIFNSPSKYIKIEFQGGEPLLNWETLRFIVEYAKKLNRIHRKKLEFVVCTNMLLLNKNNLKYIHKHNLMISTSFDGPKELHDKNRICRDGSSSYEAFVKQLSFLRSFKNGYECSPLLTTTKDHLNNLIEVIDEYKKLGFRSIFIRPLNPYGYAKEKWDEISYSMEEFIEAYKKALDYIIEINLKGYRFEEYYATLLLTRILTPFSTGFVDLQSPAGSGISGVIYDYDGAVYPADEARMLARTGDRRFLMGNVNNNTFEEIFLSNKLRSLIKNTCVEILPGCDSCVYQMYCGSEPVRYYVESRDETGHRPTSPFHKKHMALFDYFFQHIRNNDSRVMSVFWSWITGRELKDFQL